MNWNEQGGAAFPIPHSDKPGAPECEWGMSLRDWFAGQAIAGMAGMGTPESTAAWAYHVSDAMIAARSHQ